MMAFSNLRIYQYFSIEFCVLFCIFSILNVLYSIQLMAAISNKPTYTDTYTSLPIYIKINFKVFLFNWTW